jgi:NADH-quinone oxidoreductase subunit J
MNLDTIIFVLSSLIAIFGAVMMIGQRNPVASVLYFILSMLAQAVLYVQLGALFLGAILVIVYAGAILVLFLFVIMLLNLRGSEDLGPQSPTLSMGTKYLVSTLVVVELVFVVKSSLFPDYPSTGIISQVGDQFGTVVTVAELLFTKYLYPFELASVLLIAAIVGAVVTARRRSEDDSTVAVPKSRVERETRT